MSGRQGTHYGDAHGREDGVGVVGHQQQLRRLEVERVGLDVGVRRARELEQSHKRQQFAIKNLLDGKR